MKFVDAIDIDRPEYPTHTPSLSLFPLPRYNRVLAKLQATFCLCVQRFLLIFHFARFAAWLEIWWVGWMGWSFTRTGTP